MERGVVYLQHVEDSRWLLFRVEVKRKIYAVRYALTNRRYTWQDLVFHGLVWFVWFSPILLNTAINLTLKKQIASWFLWVYLVGNAMKLWRDHMPQQWQRARDGFVARQLHFGGTLKQFLPKNLDERGLHDLRCDCLYLIAEYARAWRWDVEAKKIFANLLVLDGGGATVTVIARDREKPIGATREVPKTYSIEKRHAVMRCLETGKICEVGDMKIELPNAAVEDYRNIVAFPLRKNPRGAAIAVVTIDSSEPFHLSGEAKLLGTHLQPYLSALESTL